MVPAVRFGHVVQQVVIEEGMKRLLAAAVAIIPIATAASDGKITFMGSITEPTCAQVNSCVIDGSSQRVTVTYDAVSPDRVIVTIIYT